MLAAHPQHERPKQLRVAPPKVVAAIQSRAHFLKRHVAQDFPPPVVGPEPLPEPKSELQVAHSARPDESESEQARSSQARQAQASSPQVPQL